jgi:hypothetical protein
MSIEDDVINAYNRTISRHRQRTGISYPYTRRSCVERNADASGSIYCTNVHNPELLATFILDSIGRVRVKLA